MKDDLTSKLVAWPLSPSVSSQESNISHWKRALLSRDIKLQTSFLRTTRPGDGYLNKRSQHIQFQNIIINIKIIMNIKVNIYIGMSINNNTELH